MKNKIFRFLLIVLCFLTVGFSAFVVSGGLETISFITRTLDTSNKVTINFRYYVYLEGNETAVSDSDPDYGVTYISGNQSSPNSVSGSDANYNISITYDNLTLSKQYSASPDEGDVTKATVGTYELARAASDENGYFAIYNLVVTTAIKCNATSSSGCTGTSYSYSRSGAYYIKKSYMHETITVDNFSNNVKKTLSIKKGTKLDEGRIDAMFSGLFDNYFYNGIYSSTGSGSTMKPNSPFNFSTTINSSLNLYVMYKNNGYKDGILIGSLINNKTGTTKLYDDASADYQISKDSTYLSNSKRFVLYNKGNNITIASSATINFCINSGHVYKTFTDSLNQAEPKTTNLSYKIVLGENLTLSNDSVLTIGASLSRSGASSDLQGNIAGAYVMLDLNGHTITCESGSSLKNYGLIVDTIGTGKIIVKGGATIYSSAIVYDYRGGAITSSIYDSTFPFEAYHVPYLRCNVEFPYSNNSFGSFIGFLAMTFASGNTSEQNLNIVGSGTNFLFNVLLKETNGVIKYKCEKSEKIYSGNENNCLSYRLKIEVYGVQCSIGTLSLKIYSYTINTSDYILPLAQFIDVYFYNSLFDVAKRIKLNPGSTIILDKDSTLRMTYDNTSYSGQLTTFDRAVYYYDGYKGSMIKDNAIRNGKNTAVSASSTWYTSDNFNKYNGSSSIIVLGKLLFKEGNSADYCLSGEIDFDKVGYFNNSSETLSSLKGVDGISSISSSNTNLKIRTYNYNWLVGSNYKGSGSGTGYEVKSYCAPLVSYERSIILDTSNRSGIKGTYDWNFGIFSGENGNTYFIYSGGATKSYSSTISYAQCVVNNSYNSVQCIYITYNSKNYVFYGTVFHECTSFTIDNGVVKGTINVQRSSPDKSTDTVKRNPITRSDITNYGYWGFA